MPTDDPAALVAAALALHAAATPGTWYAGVAIDGTGCLLGADGVDLEHDGYFPNPADTAFIVAAHNELVPALAAALTAATTREGALRAVLARFVHHADGGCDMVGNQVCCRYCAVWASIGYPPVVEHKPTCPITQGRALLTREGTPDE